MKDALKFIIILFIFLLPQFSLDHIGNFKYFFGGIFLLFLIFKVLLLNNPTKDYKSFLPILSFFVLCFLSLSWTSNIFDLEQSMVNIGILFLFSLVFYIFFIDAANLFESIKFFFLGILCSAIQIVLIKVLNPNIFIFEGRANILGIDPNESSILLCIGLSINLYLFKRTNNKKLFIPVIVILTAIILTASRTGLIALFAIVVIGVHFSELKMSNKIITLIFLISSIILISGFLQERVQISGDNINFDLNGRNLTWTSGLKIFQESDQKIIGLGYESFSIELDKYLWRANAHNVFLKVLFELGFLGFIILLFVLKNVLKKVNNPDTADRFLLSSIESIMLISFFSLSWIYSLSTWLIIIILTQFRNHLQGSYEPKRYINIC